MSLALFSLLLLCLAMSTLVAYACVAAVTRTETLKAGGGERLTVRRRNVPQRLKADAAFQMANSPSGSSTVQF